MDPTRFDRLARAASRMPRRRMLRALGGITLAGVASALGRSVVDAAPYSIPLGGVCYRDRQCINDYIPPRGAGLNPEYQLVYCADNGFYYDGEFNCCRYWGGVCSVDEHCCSDLACVDRFCGYWEPFG